MAVAVPSAMPSARLCLWSVILKQVTAHWSDNGSACMRSERVCGFGGFGGRRDPIPVRIRVRIWRSHMETEAGAMS